MDTSEILTKAADYIGVHGHHKGAFYHRGAVCARGAINAVLYGDADEIGWARCDGQSEEAAKALIAYLGIKTDTTDMAHNIVALGRWNDAPDRTAEQVITALRECAAELNKEGA